MLPSSKAVFALNTGKRVLVQELELFPDAGNSDSGSVFSFLYWCELLEQGDAAFRTHSLSP